MTDQEILRWAEGFRYAHLVVGSFVIRPGRGAWETGIASLSPGQRAELQRKIRYFSAKFESRKTE